MSEKSIRELIQTGESETVEFKVVVPSDNIIATNIAAFANTKGGTILIGVGDKGEITGIKNARDVSRRIEQIVRDRITPPISVSSKTLQINGKEILVVAISQSKNAPHLVQGRVFHRFGVANRLSTMNFITHLIDVAKSSPNPMRRVEEQLDRLIKANKKLEKEIKEANSWKVKAKNIIFGAIVGAIISQILIWIL